ncbi:translin-associated protein X [Metarhizium guizhouense ARSEF 977]|uniref:Translin-associated protein X n=1 Tax=Metarhizium guizhouense (strain ARSEF 977) TaxID=1276136 RepID=A0A0B4GQ30_METGA|nr:translin-associated protein X [Metarhizium guizhouense ARSEF 977]
MPAGTKRDRDGNARSRSAQDAPRTRFHSLFENFRDELDEHYDRKERVVKVSRDVTAQSKKIVKHINQGLPPSTEKDMAARMAEITALLQSVSPDVQSINRHRYSWSLRCLEELVEALSFAHYLRHQKLITPQEAAASTPGDIALTPHDYMFGIFDLFGEMMRFATVTTAQHGEMLGGEDGRNILGDIQELGCAFEALREIPTRDYRNKMEAMRQSVSKVEKLGYGLAVRGSERPKGWVPDMKDDVEAGSP